MITSITVNLPVRDVARSAELLLLRHSCATLLLVQGVSPRVVMEILGHSEIGMTMNVYSHVVPELRRDAAARMDSLIEGRPAREL